MPALVFTFCKNRRKGLVELKHVVLRVGIFSELHSSLAVLMILSVSKRKQIRTRNAMTMWQAYVFQEVFFLKHIQTCYPALLRSYSHCGQSGW